MPDPVIPISKPVAPTAYAPKSAAEAPKSNAPTEVVELPSKGLFYPENHPLASGKIEIYQVTARHEDILSNTNLLKKGTVLDEFLKALIATPGVSIDDLLIGDKNALFIASRRSAYGDVYSTKIKCPECGKESVVDIDLSKLGVKNIDTSVVTKGQNLLSFKLPNSGKTLAVSLLTHKNDSEIDQELKALAKLGLAGNSAPEITTRLKYTIKSVDGEADRGKVKAFVDEQLTAKDSLALRKFIRDHTPDMDMSFDFTCPHCDAVSKMNVPLGANFFWPNIADN